VVTRKTRWTLAELMAYDFPPTARDVVLEGRCSGSCMVADRETWRACDCRCNGTFHGALSDTELPEQVQHQAEQPEQWWDLCDRGGWSTWLLNATVPVVSGTKEFNRVYRAAKADGRKFLVVRRDAPRAYTVELDMITVHGGGYDAPYWPDDQCKRLAERFGMDLLKARRVDTASIPGTYHAWPGIATLDEAQVVAALIGECTVGNPEGTSRAVAVLEGRPDPVQYGRPSEVLAHWDSGGWLP
jgi:hypothetical protein